MAEELVMNIKSNIKGVTKDTEDLNDTLSEQKKILLELQQEEVALQQKRAKMTDYEKGLSGIDKQLEHINLSIKDQKLSVKGLTQEQSQATKQQKKYNKASKETIADFSVMGVSLNGIKKGFAKIIPTARAMFGTIKAGIISTGIGALVLAVVALAQSFKRSEAGQEKFQRIMAGIGAVTSQLLDLFSDLGETIIETVTSPMKAIKSLGNGFIKFIKDPIGAVRDIAVKTTIAVKDFVDETKKEVDTLVEVTKARQKAHHIDRQLKIDRARANREINDIRLQAEDREKYNATERIALLRKAQAIEEGITAKEIKSKKILIDAQIKEMAQGHNTIEAKDKLAQLQAELINLDTKKLRSQRLLQTQITTAINEEKAAKEQALKDEEAAWDKKIADNNKFNEDKLAAEESSAEALKELMNENMLAEIENLKERALAELEIQKEKELQSLEHHENFEELKAEVDKKYARASSKLMEDDAKDKLKIEKLTTDQKLDLASNTFKNLSKILGEETAAGKAMAVTQATIDTYKGANAAYSSMAGIPYVGPVLGAIAAGAAVASGIANVKAILATGGGGGGGGPDPSGGNIPTAGASAPAPEMMSGAFELSGGVAPEPVKAYVVTDEMSNSQDQLANIRRRATI